MSKYLVSIKGEDGTVEKLLFNNYKEISDKTGLSVGTITRMMNGVTKYHKKGTKDKLLKYKIKKLSKTNNIENDEKSDQYIETHEDKMNEQNTNDTLIEVTKFNMVNSNRVNEHTIQQLRKNLYSVFNIDNCTTFLEHNVHCNDDDMKSTINNLIFETNKQINEDTICILICNRKKIVI